MEDTISYIVHVNTVSNCFSIFRRGELVISDGDVQECDRICYYAGAVDGNRSEGVCTQAVFNWVF